MSPLQREVEKVFQLAFQELRNNGLLLKANTKLPSVTTLAAGKPIPGSWWGHPKGHVIFAVLERLVDHPDVILTKLVSGKDTFVHRDLWPALLSIAASNGTERHKGLSALARSVLAGVIKAGTMTADQISLPRGAKPKARGDAVRELENRLLIYTEEFHTERGAHSKHLESWEQWAKRIGLGRSKMRPKEAKTIFDHKLQTLNSKSRGKVTLPWNRAILSLMLLGLVSFPFSNHTHAAKEEQSMPQTAEKSTTLKILVPVLMVEDVGKTLEFYEGVLGFRRVGTVPEKPPFIFGEVIRGDVKVMFQESKSFGEDLPDLRGRPIGGTFTLYVEMEGVRQLYDEIKGKVKIIKDINETFYGTREFYIADVNGYIVGFSERVK